MEGMWKVIVFGYELSSVLALGDGVSNVSSYSQKSNVTSSVGSQSSQAQMSEEL
jgi:hypothetical protein